MAQSIQPEDQQLASQSRPPTPSGGPETESPRTTSRKRPRVDEPVQHQPSPSARQPPNNAQQIWRDIDQTRTSLLDNPGIVIEYFRLGEELKQIQTRRHVCLQLLQEQCPYLFHGGLVTEELIIERIRSLSPECVVLTLLEGTESESSWEDVEEQCPTLVSDSGSDAADDPPEPREAADRKATRGVLQEILRPE